MGLIKVRETFSFFPLKQQTHLGYELDLGLNKDEALQAFKQDNSI